MATVGHTLARSKLLLILSLLAALALALFASQLPTAQAAPVTPLPPGHTWEYTFTDPTGDPAWNTTTGGWATGPAPFGNYGPCCLFDPGTYWPVDNDDPPGPPYSDDLWVRTAIDLTGVNLSTVLWGLGVDNGFKLYANGVLVGSGNAEGWTYRWEYSGGFGGALVPGVNIIAVALDDHGGATAFDMEITGDTGPVNQPPDCSNAASSVAQIWPPNHKMVNVNVFGVTDPDGDAVAIAITGIRQDEPVNGVADGDTSPDGAGVGTDTAQVRAERAGSKKVPGDGRMYHIGYTASDGKGDTCSGVVKAGVPHDQRPGATIIDGGPLYDSTVP